MNHSKLQIKWVPAMIHPGSNFGGDNIFVTNYIDDI